MTNQTYSSQTHPEQETRKQANQRIKELAAKGEWPPVGHPWRTLALLPKQEVASFFQEETWQAVKAGLLSLRTDNVKVAVDASKDEKVREQACGVINFIDYMLGFIEIELPAYQKMIAGAVKG